MMLLQMVPFFSLPLVLSMLQFIMLRVPLRILIPFVLFCEVSLFVLVYFAFVFAFSFVSIESENLEKREKP